MVMVYYKKKGMEKTMKKQWKNNEKTMEKQ